MSYFGTKLAVFMLVFGIVFSLSVNKTIDNLNKVDFSGQISEDVIDNLKKVNFSEQIGQDDIDNVRSFVGPLKSDDDILMASLRIAQRINLITSYEEFARFFKVPPKHTIIPQVGKSITVPLPADCIPESQTVSLRPENEFLTFYYPSCTRVKRCGGCCGHSLIICEPIKIETLYLEVGIIELNLELRPVYNNTKIIPVEEHTECKCSCKIKAEDCNEKQSYRSKECRCVCKNKDEEDQCKANKDIKIWNSETCTCACRKTEICSSGLNFNNNTCRCEEKN